MGIIGRSSLSSNRLLPPRHFENCLNSPWLNPEESLKFFKTDNTWPSLRGAASICECQSHRPQNSHLRIPMQKVAMGIYINSVIVWSAGIANSPKVFPKKNIKPTMAINALALFSVRSKNTCFLFRCRYLMVTHLLSPFAAEEPCS
jgi:hypothetical protein